MSENTKKYAEQTIEYLQEADGDLAGAQRKASGTNDPGLIQKVTKIRKDVQQVVEETQKKLEQ